MRSPAIYTPGPEPTITFTTAEVVRTDQIVARWVYFRFVAPKLTPQPIPERDHLGFPAQLPDPVPRPVAGQDFSARVVAQGMTADCRTTLRIADSIYGIVDEPHEIFVVGVV